MSRRSSPIGGSFYVVARLGDSRLLWNRLRAFLGNRLRDAGTACAVGVARPMTGVTPMRSMTAGKVLGLGLWLAGAGACAGSPPPAPASGGNASATGGPSGAAAPTVDWAGMTRPERRDYMRMVVMPKAKELFVAFDPARYGKMSCGTCHGDGAEDGTFKMPNPKLPRLPPSPEGFKQLILP